MADAKAGERYQCATCGTQVVIIKTGGATPRCCGAGMLSPSAGATRAPGEGQAAQPATPKPVLPA